MKDEKKCKYPPRFKICCFKNSPKNLWFRFKLTIKNPRLDTESLDLRVCKQSAGNKTFAY